ncbi:MAG: hypothetical protein ACJ8DI_09250 [Ktedonobacteraceae bacterium]
MPDSATPMATRGYCRNSRLTLGLGLLLDARCQSMSQRLAEYIAVPVESFCRLTKGTRPVFCYIKPHFSGI